MLAEGIGRSFMKKHLGTFGEFGVLSFNGNETKQLLQVVVVQFY